MGELCRGQGLAVLLNYRFTPTHHPQVNASYAVGLSLSSYTQSLSHALMQAFAPEITATEGRGERSKMLQHANRVSKFGTFLTLLFAIPLILEIDYVLKLWLVEPPQLAGAMTTLILIAFVIERCTSGQTAAINANGEIAGYYLTVGGCMILTVPLAYCLFQYGFEAIAVCWAYLLTVLLCLLGKLYWARRLVGLSPIDWLSQVLLPCCSVLASGLLFGGLVRQCFGEASLVRLGAVVGVSTISNMAVGWMFLLNAGEKAYLSTFLERIRKRMTASRAG
jgi:O-antigen/teichoic acid export membrane protein